MQYFNLINLLYQISFVLNEKETMTLCDIQPNFKLCFVTIDYRYATPDFSKVRCRKVVARISDLRKREKIQEMKKIISWGKNYQIEHFKRLKS